MKRSRYLPTFDAPEARREFIIRRTEERIGRSLTPLELNILDAILQCYPEEPEGVDP